MYLVRKGEKQMETDEKYVVGKALGETEDFRLYQCSIPTGGVGILKIAASVANNGVLDREAFILQTLRDEAVRLEEEYAKVKTDPKRLLNYQIMFPNLVHSFISEDEGGRRINVVNFNHVGDDIGRLVPINHLVSRDHIRVDPRTSAWILGKLLKLLVFVHSQGMSTGQVTGENILIERNKHYVAFFDWSKATIHGDNTPSEIACEEISQVTKEVILALGGNPNTGVLPADVQDKDGRYAAYLYGLACGSESDASKAHEDFYEFIRTTLGWHGYHPFTTYSLERS